MAKQQSVIQFTGKLGEIVGQKSIKGDLVLRKRVTDVKTSDSQASLDARTRFIATSEAYRGLKNALYGLTHYAKQGRMTIRNAFIQLNYAVSAASPSSGTDPDSVSQGTIDYPSIALSWGNALEPKFGTPNFETPQKVTVPFTIDSLPGVTNPNDIVYLVAYNKDRNIAAINGVARTKEEAEITFPTSWSGEEVVLYGYAQQFNTAQSAITYGGYPNETGWQGNAFSRDALANSIFSYTQHIGQGTIG